MTLTILMEIHEDAVVHPTLMWIMHAVLCQPADQTQSLEHRLEDSPLTSSPCGPVTRITPRSSIRACSSLPLGVKEKRKRSRTEFHKPTRKTKHLPVLPSSKAKLLPSNPHTMP
uniref:Uncharacterized protein n=1 Tax=Cacopsylla melanoneura TaxID=428564 RepID=A0A8D8T1J2_9HEMI